MVWHERYRHDPLPCWLREELVNEGTRISKEQPLPKSRRTQRLTQTTAKD